MYIYLHIHIYTLGDQGRPQRGRPGAVPHPVSPALVRRLLGWDVEFAVKKKSPSRVDQTVIEGSQFLCSKL